MALSIETWLKNWKTIIGFNYIKDRLNLTFVKSVIRQSVYEFKYPMSPWITIEMIKILDNFLKTDDVGFEFGSGSSTVWLAKRTKKITSVEHNFGWYNKVKLMVKQYGLEKKVNLIFVGGVDKDYVRPLLKIDDDSLDYCFVDGLFRDECILMAIKKIKSGGILIVDNVDNYFPKNKYSISVRYKRDNFSKTVSKKKMGRIYLILSNWRCIWTSSAIQDTAMWIKP